MKNKKGFTLVELLAIIVILAVIMVIAVPQILNVVNGSKNGAWKNNVSMIERGIVKNANLLNPETGAYDYSIDKLCSNPSLLSKVVKVEDTNITCSGNVFTLTGTGQFTGKSATITCNNNKCSVEIEEDDDGKPKKLTKLILKNNVLRESNPDFSGKYPVFTKYRDDNFANEVESMTVSKSKYYTYASSYTFNDTTGFYTLNDPQVCKWSECYESLRGKYILTTSGSSSSALPSNTSSIVIRKVMDESTTSKLYYKNSAKTREYDNDQSGLYSMEVFNTLEQTTGVTYYFRGDVTNNYVSFANHIWKIIRINEDGSIRLVLNENGQRSVFSDDIEYYYSASKVKTAVDNWYNSNIGNVEMYDSKVSTGNYFCEALRPRNSNYMPNLSCVNDVNGHGLLSSDTKAGLISYDEVILAGEYPSDIADGNCYLDPHQAWIMNSSGVSTTYTSEGSQDIAYIWWLYAEGITGSKFYGSLKYQQTTSDTNFYPVINLKTDVTATGTGTESNPYVIAD